MACLVFLKKNAEATRTRVFGDTGTDAAMEPELYG